MPDETLQGIQNQNDTNLNNQDAIMNKVNQTFEKMTDEVKNILNENNQQNSL